MKKVLIVTNHYINEIGGGAYATLAYVRTLCSFSNYNVDIICPEFTKTNFTLPNELAKNCIYQIIDNRGFVNKLFGLLFGQITRFNLKSKELSCIKVADYEIVFFDGSTVAGDLIQFFKGIRTVTFHHNVEIDYHKGERSDMSFLGLWLWNISRKQRLAWQNSNLNLTITEYDKLLLTELYGQYNNSKTIGVWQHSDVFNSIEIKSSEIKQKIRVAITGTLSAKQTVLSIFEFLKENKTFLSSFDDLQIIIAGKNPSKQVMCLNESYFFVDVIPNPIDMNEIINSCSIFLCPINRGGGLKLRVMDGLKNGLPTIVNKISSRGYEYFIDEPWFKIYADSKTFEITFMELYNEVKKKQYDPVIVSKKYEEQFSFSAGQLKLQKILKDL